VAAEVRRLERLVLEIRGKAGKGGRLFGSITSQQIAEALIRRGFSVTRKQIELEEPIRVEGFYKVPIRVGAGAVVQVDLNVIGTS
jgi:large subunit ribosomal protein L9